MFSHTSVLGGMKMFPVKAVGGAKFPLLVHVVMVVEEIVPDPLHALSSAYVLRLVKLIF